jgi:tRNA-binding EMAP/Myf-like protein
LQLKIATVKAVKKLKKSSKLLSCKWKLERKRQIIAGIASYARGSVGKQVVVIATSDRTLFDLTSEDDFSATGSMENRYSCILKTLNQGKFHD